METLQNHQQAVEKVVAKERLINGHWINPCTVNNPRTEEMEDEHHGDLRTITGKHV